MRGQLPSRGDVWLVDPDPTRGHEQAGRRPAVVVSADFSNHGPQGLVVMVPVTRRRRRTPLHLEIAPPEGGLRAISYVKCEDVRSMSTDRLIERWGVVSEGTLRQLADRLSILLDL